MNLRKFDLNPKLYDNLQGDYSGYSIGVADIKTKGAYTGTEMQPLFRCQSNPGKNLYGRLV